MRVPYNFARNQYTDSTRKNITQTLNRTKFKFTRDFKFAIIEKLKKSMLELA